MKEIKMNPVTSSQISSVGYDPDLNELFVEFKSNKKVYRYTDVPESVYHQFMASDSIGSYFIHNIKPQYEYELLNVLVDDDESIRLEN